MNTYTYKVIELKPNETNSEQKFTDALNAGAVGGWEFKAIENQNNKFYIVYQKLAQQIL